MSNMILKLEFTGEVPLYQQIRNQIVMGIASGELVPGEHLPTIRALAEETGINMMTVSKAYQLLRQEGYISTDRRSGAVVCRREPGTPMTATLENLRLQLCELRAAGLGKEDILALCEKLMNEEAHSV